MTPPAKFRWSWERDTQNVRFDIYWRADAANLVEIVRVLPIMLADEESGWLLRGLSGEEVALLEKELQIEIDQGTEVGQEVEEAAFCEFTKFAHLP